MNTSKKPGFDFSTKNRMMIPITKFSVQLYWIFALVIFGTIFSSLIPPFQSPDEFDHIKRAYMLSSGQALLHTMPGASSGGNVDTGLLEYMAIFTPIPFNKNSVVSKHDIDRSEKIRWQNSEKYSAAPGTGYYFPIVYVPQAIALFAGRHLNFSVDSTYRLARFLTLLSAIAGVVVASRIFPMNFFVISLCILPMTIFQFCSASIDGFTTSIALICISMFMAESDKGTTQSKFAPYILSALILLLASCRPHLTPLLLMPVVIYFRTKRRVNLYLFVGIAVCVLLWLGYGLTYPVDLRVLRTDTTAFVLKYYLIRPRELIAVLWKTVTNTEILKFYIKSFIGVLGWLDLELSSNFYALVSVVLTLISVATIKMPIIKSDWAIRGCLVSFSLISVFLVFFLLLITWTPHVAEHIQGVQGRYFLIPALLVAYSLSGYSDNVKDVRHFAALMALCFICLLIAAVIPKELLWRYYIALKS